MDFDYTDTDEETPADMYPDPGPTPREISLREEIEYLEERLDAKNAELERLRAELDVAMACLKAWTGPSWVI